MPLTWLMESSKCHPSGGLKGRGFPGPLRFPGEQSPTSLVASESLPPSRWDDQDLPAASQPPAPGARPAGDQSCRWALANGTHGAKPLGQLSPQTHQPKRHVSCVSLKCWGECYVALSRQHIPSTTSSFFKQISKCLSTFLKVSMM